MTWRWIGKGDGRSGLEWKIATEDGETRVYIPGTDHQDDVTHHLRVRLKRTAPGVWITAADLDLAWEIFLEIRMTGCTVAHVGGHSWGGAIAAIVVWLLNRAGINARGYLYAPKRAGNGRFVSQVADKIDVYVHRGDLVPLLPPWLAAYPRREFGQWEWPWKAHLPYQYHEQMIEDGFRDAD